MFLSSSFFGIAAESEHFFLSTDVFLLFGHGSKFGSETLENSYLENDGPVSEDGPQTDDPHPSIILGRTLGLYSEVDRGREKNMHSPCNSKFGTV